MGKPRSLIFITLLALLVLIILLVLLSEGSGLPYPSTAITPRFSAGSKNK